MTRGAEESRQTAAAIVELALADETICARIAALIAPCPVLPQAETNRGAGTSAIRLRCMAELRPVLEAALADAAMDAERHDAIRRFFLEPQERYTIDDLASLWAMPPEHVCEIFYDEIMKSAQSPDESTTAFHVTWYDAVQASSAFSVFRPYEVERALGSEFCLVRSPEWRTVPTIVRLPRFAVSAFDLDATTTRTVAVASRIEQCLLDIVMSSGSLPVVSPDQHQQS